jgi:hypothetical protein|tara:strand:+ start:461 stop:883 length:423 start_codon:yes stop_codon:yes gene_type:complete
MITKKKQSPKKQPRKADKVRAYLVNNKAATPAQVAKATGVSYGYTYKLMRKIVPPTAVFVAEEEAKSTRKKPQAANQRQVGGQHYVALSVEPWAAIEAWMTNEEFVGFLKGNIIKYLAREKNTNDLDKAGHYMQKLLEVR